jgi:uncharacterized protein YidB (DUF937 family)
MEFQDILGKIGGQQGTEGGVATIQKLFGAKQMQGVLNKLRSNGCSKQVQSWIGKGRNQPISSADVQRAVDPAMLQQCAQEQGMSPKDLCGLVAQALPEMVSEVTPDGKMPSQDPFTQGMSAFRKMSHI